MSRQEVVSSRHPHQQVAGACVISSSSPGTSYRGHHNAVPKAIISRSQSQSPLGEEFPYRSAEELEPGHRNGAASAVFVGTVGISIINRVVVYCMASGDDNYLP